MPTRPRANAFSFSTQDHIWCPGLDDEMKDMGRSFIENMGLHPEVLAGGGGQLGAFTPTSKLYVLCHAHSNMPLFETGIGAWTAEQLVTLLRADGLPSDQRDIELLVCFAGESVNYKDNAQQLLQIREKALQRRAKGKSSSALEKKFAQVEAQAMQTSSFEGEEAHRMLLPMAAQIASNLKGNGFTHFRVISYKSAVTPFCPKGKIHLDLTDRGGPWGVPIDKKPDYRVIWH